MYYKTGCNFMIMENYNVAHTEPNGVFMSTSPMLFLENRISQDYRPYTSFGICWVLGEVV